MDEQESISSIEDDYQEISTQSVHNTLSPEKMVGKRLFPELRSRKSFEWTFYDDGYHYGKRCYIDGERKGNCQSLKETTLVDIIGRSRKVQNTRGGLPMVSDGDKSYAIPEYAYNFHSEGSTLPVINFSRSWKPISDTFIPLQPLQRNPRRIYTAKKERNTRRRREERSSKSIEMATITKPNTNFVGS